MRLPRAESVLPLLIAVSACALIFSEFLVAFEFTPPGGEVLADQTAADRHSYAMLVLGIAALVATVVALRTGARPAAFAVAGFGLVALLLFLVIDLPDAGQIGALEDFITARADAQPGFWLGAIGALGLAVGGGGLATLTPEQLRAPAERFGLAVTPEAETGDDAAGAGRSGAESAAPAAAGDGDGAHSDNGPAPGSTRSPHDPDQIAGPRR